MSTSPTHVLDTVPVTIEPPDEAYGYLALAITRLKLGSASRDMFARFPSVQRASLRLAWFATPRLIYPFTNTPILMHCINDAMIAGGKADNAGEDPRTAYLEALLRGAGMILEIEVICGGHHWDPLTGLPLGQWLLDNPEAEMGMSRSENAPLPAPDRYHAALALRIVEPEDIRDLVLEA